MHFSQLLQTRRSVHEYSDESIDTDTLESVFEAASLAPSGYNLQPWEFLLVGDAEAKADLAEIAYGQDHVAEADTVAVVLGNTDLMAHAEPVFEDWLAKGYIPNEDVRDALLGNVEEMNGMPEAERRIWTTRSSALAAMTVMYAAWDHGIASCPMEGFDPNGLIERFGIPEGYEPVMLITLGYPAEETADIENERKGRRPVKEIVHYGSFEPSETTKLEAPTFE